MDVLLNEIAQYWLALKAFLAFDKALLSEPSMIARLCVQVLLLFGSAFFSGSETALFSLSRLDLQKLRRDRHPRSETLHALLDQPRRLIISILLGNEVVNIAAAANMAGILVVLYGPERAGWITLLVMVPLLLLFGEVTPKTVGVSNPVRMGAGFIAGPMDAWVRLVTPLRWAVRGIADWITTLIVGREKTPDNILQVDEFLSLVEEVAKEGELNATERALIYNLLEAGDTEIVEIMTPRTRTDFINAESGVSEMVELFRAFRHPRVPVFRTHRDNLVGVLHAEDILRLILEDTDLNTLTPEDIMHPPVVAPLTKKVDEMFDFFRSNNVRAAAVLNEFGGVEGFTTMTDVLSFIFGQISGRARGQEFYQEQDENVYEVPGEMRLTDFNNLTNFGIEDPRMTTIGGVMFRHLDRLPRVGDQVVVEGIVITVLEMDAHRIARVRVARGVALEEDAAEQSDVDSEQAVPELVTEQGRDSDREAVKEPAGEAASETDRERAPQEGLREAIVNTTPATSASTEQTPKESARVAGEGS